MHNSCRCALITMTGAIVLAAATIAVGFSAGSVGDVGHGRTLTTIPAAAPPPGVRDEPGTPIPDSYLSNRS
jgi:hypothetical protein